VIIAEIGPHMSRFPSARHVASWVAICPGNDESACKRRLGKTRRGNPYPCAALIESTNAAARTKNSCLRGQYEQVKRRRGHRDFPFACRCGSHGHPGRVHGHRDPGYAP
jgi:transposase